jgi:tungstate transport system permease protein
VAEITLRSLQVTLAALAISTLIGLPLGAWLGLRKLPMQALINGIVYTGMGLPPVVVGLVVYLLLSRSGPIGALGWLYSVPAMIIAQTILALPVIAGLTMSSLRALDPLLKLQLRSLGATDRQIALTLLAEARSGVLVGIAAGFGSIISEVGAVMLVGGNIAGQTRVLTGAIVLETRQGHFDLALALGIILLVLALASNLIIVLLQGRAR